jgi:hypothetical protein
MHAAKPLINDCVRIHLIIARELDQRNQNYQLNFQIFINQYSVII